MFACTKKSFRPTLETLEDRCMPSASPWATLAQPVMNMRAAEAALGRILQHGQQQLDTFQAMSRDLLGASQQAQAATVTQTPGYEAVYGKAVMAQLNPIGYIGPGWQTLGTVWVHKSYANNSKFELRVACRTWAVGTIEPSGDQGYDRIEGRSNVFKMSGGTQVGDYVAYNFQINGSYFHNQPKCLNARFLFVVAESTGAKREIDRSAPAMIYAIGPVYQSQTGAGMIHTEGLDVGNHEAAVQMSARDQVFVALGHGNHPDGLPQITAGDWGR